MGKEKEFMPFDQKELVSIPVNRTIYSSKHFHCPACPFFDKIGLVCAWYPQAAYGEKTLQNQNKKPPS